MRRLPLVIVIFSLAHAPVAFAGEPLLTAALRAADELGKRQPPAPSASASAATDHGAQKGKTPAATAYAQEPTGAPARMSGRRKTILGIGLAAAFAGIMLAIDGGVEDNTPSTRGERRNKL